jgi:hypothetical protein
MLVLAFMGCGAKQGNGQVDQAESGALDGTWVWQSKPSLGASLTMRLQLDGQDVTGCGFYSIEAGRKGPLSIQGHSVNAGVDLIIDYDFGRRATYSAHFADPNTLAGTFADHNSDSLENFVFTRSQTSAQCTIGG